MAKDPEPNKENGQTQYCAGMCCSDINSIRTACMTHGNSSCRRKVAAKQGAARLVGGDNDVVVSGHPRRVAHAVAAVVLPQKTHNQDTPPLSTGHCCNSARSQPALQGLLHERALLCT